MNTVHVSSFQFIIVIFLLCMCCLKVITAVLNKITRGCKPFTVRKGGRIPKEYFGSNSGESKLFIHRNELLLGVIDKGQFGKFGLVHTVHELYGSNTAGTLLSALSRLFTVYLQVSFFIPSFFFLSFCLNWLLYL